MAKRTRQAIQIPTSLEPMEAELVDALPDGEGWQFEPKWDGFRCLAFRSGERIELQAKSGKSLTRYFPEVVERLRALEPQHFVIDGELAIPVGTRLDFDALLMRLHPAESRIRKLSLQSPAVLLLFDCLIAPEGVSLLNEPLYVRREALEAFFAALSDNSGFGLSPYTRDPKQARKWLQSTGASLDGVVAKRIDDVYRCGERAMLKVKRIRTADCVVGGFRYGTNSKEVTSLLLGLYNDEGLLDHVGFTSSIPKTERAALTKLLNNLEQAPGFTGNAPGGPSRWSTERSSDWHPLRPELVVEVSYDHVTANRFRHGTRLLRWRPDKSPQQCTFEQIAPSSHAPDLLKTLQLAAGPTKKDVRKPQKVRSSKPRSINERAAKKVSKARGTTRAATNFNR